MEKHFQRELDKLKKSLLTLGAMVEEAVRLSIRALETRDVALANKVINGDSEIDEKEVEIEEECLKILALHQPVAIDLRLISAMIKINNDLERVGDEAANIAERAIAMAKNSPMDIGIDYRIMAEKTESMLKKSLDAVVNLDTNLAHEVCLADDEIDKMHASTYTKVKQAIPQGLDRIGYFINLISTSRHLERIADHATNIAEEVIYVVEGIIHRHVKHDDKPTSS
jgi:phosphate transport system protein